MNVIDIHKTQGNVPYRSSTSAPAGAWTYDLWNPLFQTVSGHRVNHSAIFFPQTRSMRAMLNAMLKNFTHDCHYKSLLVWTIFISFHLFPFLKNRYQNFVKNIITRTFELFCFQHELRTHRHLFNHCYLRNWRKPKINVTAKGPRALVFIKMICHMWF